VANADPKQMVHSIDHMPKKTANQIIAAAKVSNFSRSSKHLKGENECDMFL
jgi:hypothetical protein